MLAERLSALALPKIASFFAAAGRLIAVFFGHVLRDLPILAFAGAIVYGIWLIYIPAAWITGGIFGILFMLVVAKPAVKTP